MTEQCPIGDVVPGEVDGHFYTINVAWGANVLHSLDSIDLYTYIYMPQSML